MSKYIEKGVLLERMNRTRPYEGENGSFERHRRLQWLADMEQINICPAADVVEVVRCGECIHWNAETKGCKRNPSVYRWYAKDFCSNGVR